MEYSTDWRFHIQELVCRVSTNKKNDVKFFVRVIDANLKIVEAIWRQLNGFLAI